MLLEYPISRRPGFIRYCQTVNNQKMIRRCLLIQGTNELLEDSTINCTLHLAELNIDRPLVVFWQLHNRCSKDSIFECPSAHNLIQEIMQSRVAIIAAFLTITVLKVTVRSSVWDA